MRDAVLGPCGVTDMRIAENTLAEKAAAEVTYSDQCGEDPYRFNLGRMDSHGGWIATPTDLVKFAMHVDGFTTTPSILKKSTIEVMTTPSAINPQYAKGWFITPQPNWWHGGLLPGTTTIMVRTATGYAGPPLPIRGLRT